MSLVKWNNGGLIPQFSRMVENFFRDDDDFFQNWKREMNVPAVNVKELDDSFKMEFAVPGMKKDDFKIEVKENMLIVSCEKKMEKEEKKDDFTRREFSYSSFNRSFWMPENTKPDAIKAEYKDGILMLMIPKMKISKPENIKKIAVS